MQSMTEIRPTTNPYLIQLVSSVSGEVDVSTFSWWAALRGNFDVLHIHWPEVMLRDPSSIKTWLRRLAFLALLLRIRLGGRALVRTMHNRAPHEPGSRSERWLLSLSERLTTVWIRLNESAHPPGSAPVATIAHGDYRDWYIGAELPPMQPGTLLYFGLVRPYKGIDRLLDAFAESTDPGMSLRISGKAEAGALRERIEAAQRADRRITAQLRFLTDPEVAHEMGCAEMIVLPYRDMFNSGSLLLALSLGRPVLVPSTEVTEQLADEVGRDWVICYSGELSSETLSSALAATRRPGRTREPDLSRRSWDHIGSQHVAAYRQAASLSGRDVSEV
ncbi:MAG: beta,4-mannosyltransferase [Pseudonocardiales bacterium]|jgi:beta-1,4-mannosyltransferase|nr:beta,4-mannosyltransferase [Pseudonocardiales bacterium]